MIFIRDRKVKNIRRVLDKNYMFKFFSQQKKHFLKEKEELINIKIDLIRNFREKFRNMSLRYELKTNKRNIIIRARTHKHQNLPEREWKIFNYLKKNNLGKFIPHTLFYFKPFNILFYKEVSGISFEELLSQRKINVFLKFVPQIAKGLSKIHVLKRGPNILVKDLSKEKKERQHWFFLMRKCGFNFYPEFSFLLKKLWELRRKNIDLFLKPREFKLVHSDFHWGNILLEKNKNKYTGIKFIDFCYGFYGDPLEDVGGLLAQNDSMFRYYAPDFSKRGEKLKKEFLKNYFKKSISKSTQVRLIYFEAQKILEMAAMLAFVEPSQDNKRRGITRLLLEAKTKIDFLEKFLSGCIPIKKFTPAWKGK